MPPLSLLIKPSSGMCNMRCEYCFYADEAAKRSTPSYGFMSEETQEAMVRKALSYARGSCAFLFQGGEPTLIGLPFYERLIELEEKYNINQLPIHHAIQTNGYRMDADFAAFLAKHRFLAGISLDGNRRTHDSFRKNREGGGTFEDVMKTIALFDRYKVDYNILTVVNSRTAQEIDRIWNFYKKNGFRYLQFIACLDPLLQEEAVSGGAYSLTPEAYGTFLIRLFDLWAADLREGNYTSVRQFDNYVQMLLGHPPESCDLSGHCAFQNVVEADGSVYPCDFYVLDEYRMGNLNECGFEELKERGKEMDFVRASVLRPERCERCPYLRVCRGGCRRHRQTLPDGTLGENIFCPSFTAFFEHAMPMLMEIAESIASGKRF